jgi:hypothetical protein
MPGVLCVCCFGWSKSKWNGAVWIGIQLLGPIESAVMDAVAGNVSARFEQYTSQGE